jgi:hypothetical protein
MEGRVTPLIKATFSLILNITTNLVQLVVPVGKIHA